MSRGTERDARREALHAYHDGELSAFARWRFERALRRSPELRQELRALEAVGDVLRESHATAPAPDLWPEIAPRLAALDAARAEREALPRWRSPVWWLKPAGALAAGVALSIWVVDWTAPGPVPGSAGVVRWLDSGGRNVMVLEGSPGTTIVWPLEASEDGARGGGHATV